MKTLNRQQGVALLTAVLVVALAVIAATSIVSSHQLSIRRAENIIFGSQVWSYLHGGEAWAKVILARDLDDDRKYDHASEAWATELPALPLPGGFISGKIADEQGKINLNNLISDEQANAEQSDLEMGAERAGVLARRQLERLFLILDQDQALVQAVIDWIDPNFEAIPPHGAEDDYYTGLDYAYLAANQPMRHISELRLVKGFTQEVYDRVSPYLTALPTVTAVNINSAAPEVLAALVADLSLDAARVIADERNEEPFETVQSFIAHPLVRGVAVNLETMSIQSSYFSLSSQVKIGNSFIRNKSILNRASNSNVTVLMRTPQ